MRALAHFLERIGCRHARHGAHPGARARDYGVDRAAAHEGPRGIVHQHDRGLGGERIESRAHRVGPLRATRHETQPLAAQLAEPVGRTVGVPGRQRDDRVPYFRAARERANARSSIGTPRMGRNCFGSPGPRAPRAGGA
jgi:hypothetical protein